MTGKSEAWEVSGSYSKSFANPFDTAFGPEQSDTEDVECKMLPISKNDERPWMFDLEKALGGQNKAGYVFAWVHPKQEHAARLESGTDDGKKLWLNGKLVHTKRARGAAVPGEHKVDVKLTKGWNVLLLKVTQDTGPRQFCLAIFADVRQYSHHLHYLSKIVFMGPYRAFRFICSYAEVQRLQIYTS